MLPFKLLLYRFSLVIVLLALTCSARLLAQHAEPDTALPAKKVAEPPVRKRNGVDTFITKPFRDPKKATIRSAILPGWGQLYNRKYWKAPIVWGALGTCIGIFSYNLKQYKDLRKAYQIISDSNSTQTLDPKYVGFSAESIRYARNSARQYVDYSGLAFLLLWGLNVLDATVDAHLNNFDVSDNLSLHLQPGYMPGSNVTGFGVVMDIHKAKHRNLALTLSSMK